MTIHLIFKTVKISWFFTSDRKNFRFINSTMTEQTHTCLQISSNVTEFYCLGFLSRFQFFFFFQVFLLFFESIKWKEFFSFLSFTFQIHAKKNVTIQLKLIKLNGKNLFNSFACWFIESMFNVNDDYRINRVNVQCVNHIPSILFWNLRLICSIECVLLHDSRHGRHHHRHQIWIQIDNTGSDDIPWIHACSQCPLAYLRYDAVIGALSVPTYCISTFNYRLAKHKKLNSIKSKR